MHDQRQILKYLQQNPVFAQLDSADLQALVQRAAVQTFEAKQIVLHEHTTATHVFALLHGSVRVFHRSPNGLEVVVKIFKAPSIFGEIEVLADLSLYLENVSTLEPSTLAAIRRADFLALVQRAPAFTTQLLRDVAARFCIATHNEKSVAFDTVRTRLANFILSCSQFDGRQTEHGIRLRIGHTQQDMANAIGATARAVAKEMKRWQQQHTIVRHKGYYCVRDVAQLQSEASGFHLGITYALGQPLVGATAQPDELPNVNEAHLPSV